MKLRAKICLYLFEISAKPYARYFKRKCSAWGFTSKELLQFPKKSLGHALGLFLNTNGFEPLDKLETHDIYHVITNYGTTVRDEIALQYLFLGNGKRSLYLWMVIAIGTILNPEFAKHYSTSFRLGKKLLPFYHLDYRNLLHTPLQSLREHIYQQIQVPGQLLETR